MTQPPAGNGNGTNGNMYTNGAAVNGVILPSAGHYADMQTLMQSMETLSGWLQQNREEWASLQEGLARVERVQARNEHEHDRNSRISHPDAGAMAVAGGEGLVNGDTTQTEMQAAQQPPLPGPPAQDNPPENHPRDRDPDNDPTRPTTTALQTALSAAHTRISHLESSLRTHETLQTLYEATLSDATAHIRSYIYSQQSYILSLHRHYTELLQQAREEVVEAQLVHQGWQEGLGRLSGLVRGAYGAREEERRPWVGRVRGLREENRVLRGMVGWEVREGDSDEEEEIGEGGYGVIKGGGG
ncbi:hypothetical protein LTR91_017454 [Friedmanniomyces endolithicus]|uniref:Uncharacterized protein n=1 Tax=Friedmanniomyces endolithicus TaxID=329885 RepID=A0AAN6K604_9PEZI|nr:hypothetical protein LTR94_008999 [Friedmanniomyces endolithicus]KAK0780818.1 hypothetical protein LTR59_012722 [Friedmanniomyces endolithicus]KAK0786263.1 hypothetical protein LTR38_012084 [Friedmanniomyces endolithicus]KAK0808603.1 hypothetical protein LTR75_006180 [Friedmanniomyces endolithicus]KAK0854635.1 hypothetical protein LTS02_011438 [Friedmanniomyces endolithicus]